MDFERADLFTDLNLVPDPYPYFEYLRSKGPVVRLPNRNVVAVTGYEEGLQVLLNDAVFSSINSATGPIPPLPFEPHGEDISAQLEEYRSQMPMGAMLVTQDPPVHRRSRTLIMGLLTPKRFRENEEFLWRLADRKIDEFIGKTKVEFVGEMALPFATLAIADLLGVPEEDHVRFDGLWGPLPGQIGGDAPMENNPLAQVGMLFYGYILDRRASPRQDVLTELARVEYPGGGLPPVEEIVGHAAVLFGAGQDTTVRLMAAMMRKLAEDRDLQVRLREDRSLIPNFLEEVLRLEGPVKSDFRTAKRAAKVGSVEVAPGTTIMLLPGAMNRDARHFDEPNAFHADRKNARDHVAFGRGIHSCIGASLARAEARTVLDKCLTRLADFRLDEGVHGPAGARRFDYEPNYTQRALRDLHLEFTAA